MTEENPHKFLATLEESGIGILSILEKAANFTIYQNAMDPEQPFGGIVLMVSPSIKNIAGIQDPYQFKAWFENMYPDNLPQVIQANIRALEAGESYDQFSRVYDPEKRNGFRCIPFLCQ